MQKHFYQERIRKNNLLAFQNLRLFEKISEINFTFSEINFILLQLRNWNAIAFQLIVYCFSIQHFFEFHPQKFSENRRSIKISRKNIDWLFPPDIEFEGFFIIGKRNSHKILSTLSVAEFFCFCSLRLIKNGKRGREKNGSEKWETTFLVD